MSDAAAPGPTPPPNPAAVKAAQQRRLRLQFERVRSKYVRDLITPEGAALHLKIGTFAERAAAFTIDFLLQWSVVIAVLLSVSFATSAMGLEGQAFGQAFMGVFVFVFRNFYFVFFEMGRKAATPGKRVCGLRVASRDGGALKADAVLARNFMREIEVGLPLSFLFVGGDGLGAAMGIFGLLWAGVFMFFPLFNKDKLRVGDLIAGTWVIHAPKDKLKADISKSVSEDAKRSFAFKPQQVDAYGIHELHVLEDVLRESEADVRADVARRIREKINWQMAPGESDLAFLEAYYAALRRRLEQRMLFGEKKVDKFD
ncbi:MAG: RDD family protein, partial [Pseudomonadota bacterium]